MQKEETRFRKRVDTFLNSLPNCKHFSIQQKTICGDPDKLICLNGYFIALELKKDEESLKKKGFKLQAYTLSQVTHAGGFGLVSYPGNWEKTKEALKLIAGGPSATSNLENAK